MAILPKPSDTSRTSPPRALRGRQRRGLTFDERDEPDEASAGCRGTRPASIPRRLRGPRARVRRPAHNPDLPEPRRRRAHREVARIERRVDFLPGERRRDAGERAGAGAVGGRERLALDVLQEVDVDGALPPPRDGALDCRRFRMPRRDHRRDDLAEEHAGFVRRVRRQRNVDVQAARPGRLREAGHLQRAQLVAHPARDVENGGERRGVGRDRDRSRRSRRRAATARARTTGPARWPRAASSRAASSAIRRRTASPRAPPPCAGRTPAADAVGEALHHERPIGDARKDERRDLDVVAEQIALGDLVRRGGQNSLARLVTLTRVAVRAA